MKLTPRESQIILLIGQYKNQEIADLLLIELKTVENHLRSAYRKLNAKNRTEAIINYLKTHD